MRKENIVEFVEAEFQPTSSTVVSSYTRRNRPEDLELQNVKPLVISSPLQHKRTTKVFLKQVPKLQDIQEEAHEDSEATEASFV